MQGVDADLVSLPPSDDLLVEENVDEHVDEGALDDEVAVLRVDDSTHSLGNGHSSEAVQNSEDGDLDRGMCKQFYGQHISA